MIMQRLLATQPINGLILPLMLELKARRYSTTASKATDSLLRDDELL